MTRFSVALATALVFAAAPRVTSSQSVEARLAEYMSARESLGQFSGAVLVARNGRVLLSQGYGYADMEKRIPNTASTRFRAASITKQFTAMGILRLREAGKLSLNDSICRFIDRCPAAWKPVTLAHLIHHSSGIPDYEEALEMQSEKYATFMARPTSSMIVDSARTKPLDFAPGSKFHYSNTGYMLLAKVIERVSKMSYPDYMRKTIFDRVGMENSGILPPGGQVRGIAKGYSPGKEIALESLVAGLPLVDRGLKVTPEIDMSGIHGDGGLYTTVGDLYRWIETLSDTTYLTPSLREEYLTPGLANGEAPPQTGYAFGWIIDTDLGMKVQGHTGALPGFISRMQEYPDSGLVVIVMANTDFFRLTRIARDLASAALGKPYDIPRSHAIVTLDSAAVRPLVGEYVLENGTPAKVTIGQRYLELAVTGRFDAGLLPEGPALFYVPFFEGTVRFHRDNAGAVTALVMHYDGTDRVVRRKPD